MQDSSLNSICHLSNFAYDPVNYEIFDKLNILEFFLDLLHFNTESKKEFEFAMAGIANLSAGNIMNLICLDIRFAKVIALNLPVL